MLQTNKGSKGCLQKQKKYVDRETVPKEGMGVASFAYKNHSRDREYSSIGREV